MLNLDHVILSENFLRMIDLCELIEELVLSLYQGYPVFSHRAGLFLLPRGRVRVCK